MLSANKAQRDTFREMMELLNAKEKTNDEAYEELVRSQKQLKVQIKKNHFQIFKTIRKKDDRTDNI